MRGQRAADQIQPGAAGAFAGVDRPIEGFAPVAAQHAVDDRAFDRDVPAVAKRAIFVGVGAEFAERQSERADPRLVELDVGQRVMVSVASSPQNGSVSRRTSVSSVAVPSASPSSSRDCAMPSRLQPFDDLGGELAAAPDRRARWP